MVGCPLILVTNDDGIHAEGLRALAETLASLGRVVVYAPDSQQSAVGHGVTLRRPLRVTKVAPDRFMVDGTPTDCVMLAVRGLMDRRPDLVVSGINAGANLGDDVTYSGTVAGAFEGMLLGIPSVAVSLVGGEEGHFDTAARAALAICRDVLDNGLPRDIMLNVNVPDVPWEQVQGMTITSLGRRNYQEEIVIRTDPRGTPYYWIGGADPDHYPMPGSDFEAIEHRQISITPLSRDLTAWEALHSLAGRFGHES
ncbi:MAG TPA: 5'/3'-nucleotidase SurE [Candidatus Hydrogenedentes bacterium]|nr:5'/3'-nucleotidase SurE [Candidatus Hydrogenedentota bacterium]